jgi:ABC-2 type transport system ATP-binding protein
MIATLEEMQTGQRPKSGGVVASLEGVSKNYGEIRALRAVNFTVNAGQVVALLGPNGAGKTTAVKLLLGLIQPNTGRVRVFGGDPTNPANRMRTGAMLQVGKVPETLKVGEHIDLFSSYYQSPMSLEGVLAAAGLEKLRDRKFGDLSGGQRQRTLFALAICGNPDLLFLDEPTVGLDVEARRVEKRFFSPPIIWKRPTLSPIASPLLIRAKSSRKAHRQRSRRKPVESGFVALRRSTWRPCSKFQG